VIDMEGVKFVKVVTTNNSPVEDFLFQVKKEFIFHGSYFDDCDTKEQIEEMFLDGSNPDDYFDKHEVFLFKTKRDVLGDKHEC